MARPKKWIRYCPWNRGLQFVYKMKNTPWQRIKERDLIFILLCWCGVPRSLAYCVAYPESQASEESRAQLASRLLNDYKFRNVLEMLAEKEDYLEFRYLSDQESAKHSY